MAGATHDPVADRLQAVGLEFGHGLALDLSRITAALDALGRPQDHLPPVIHVAGTNGKGSTCAFLRAIAEAAGLRAHVFTSPHLIHARERVRLAGQLVSDEDFIAAIDEVADCGVRVTFFETVTAAAFLLFARQPADVVILEVGMGGLHDATNVIAAPALSVITPVDLDHQAFLGDTIAAIAVQKAGILKPGRPALIGRQTEDGRAAIEREAERIGAPLWTHGQDFDAFATPNGFAVQTPERFLDLPMPSLLGPHQIDNAGLAVAAGLAWGHPAINADAVAAGVMTARWPGRLQPLTDGAIGALARQTQTAFFADGAHNAHGARALAAALNHLSAKAPARTVLVFGMFANKDVAASLKALTTAIDALIAVPVKGQRAHADPALLAQAAQDLGLSSQTADDLQEALPRAAELAGPGGRVVICGSLHLAGEAIAAAGGID
jgi:dihydrofolate synthase/folylpolyglutamate synthase